MYNSSWDSVWYVSAVEVLLTNYYVFEKPTEEYLHAWLKKKKKERKKTKKKMA